MRQALPRDERSILYGEMQALLAQMTFGQRGFRHWRLDPRLQGGAGAA
jgi:hypothetical protein